MKLKVCVLVAAALIGAAGLPVFAGGRPGTLEDRVGWKSLYFSASKWLNRVDTRIDVKTVDAVAAVAVAPESNQGKPVQASSARIGQIRIRTTIDPLVGDTVELDKKFWFDPVKQNVLFGQTSRVGQEEYLRRFRFTTEGVFRFRREPRSPREAALAPPGWSDTKASFYAYDPQKWGCRQVVEPGVLIYLISNIMMTSPDATAAFCVFHKRQLYRVSFRHNGLEPLAVDYRTRSALENVRVKKRAQVVKVLMQAMPLGDYRGEVESFSFLGFKKDVGLYIDPDKALPVMISGHLPGIGQAELRLVAVELPQ